MKYLFFFIVLSLLSFTHSSYSKDSMSMNGIDFKTYAGFEEKWELVTVRYRNDNKELRFVYANPIASQAMKKNLKVYPEGSVFAKVAYLAESDPAFESSLGPSQSRRFQFMVKNNKKYKAQNGWGYALFNYQGNVAPEPVDQQVNACAACHSVVPERDYVFSRKFNKAPSKHLNLFQLQFEEIARNLLPDQIQKILPANFQTVLKIKSSLTKNIFQGTLDEMKPSLAKLSVSNKKPALFLSDDKTKFTLVYPEDLSIECEDEGAKGLYLLSINSMLSSETNKIHFCQSYFK